MAAFVFLVIFLALASPSYANYCLCKDSASQQALQKAIDYACGAGADCSPILTGGACFQPNTVKDHCNYAVNSYFQRKGQVQGSCDFSGAATPSVTLTTSAPSGCVYPSSPSNAGTSPTNSGGNTPSSPGGSTPMNPGGTTPSMTPGTTNPGMTPTVFGNGISPSGGYNDGSGGVGFNENRNLLSAVALILWLSVLLFWG